MSTHRVIVTLDPGPPENNPRISIVPDMLELLPERDRATIVDLIHHALRQPNPTMSRLSKGSDSLSAWIESRSDWTPKRAEGERPPGDPNRYQQPMNTGEPHPLKDVPYDLLEAARDTLWEISTEGDIDVSLVEPVADTLTLAVWSWMKEHQ